MSKKYPKVSVIILNLNGREIIPTCLSSLKELSYPKEKLEIIVVDNGSTDESVGFIKKNHPEVRIKLNSKNLGFCRPNNTAAKIAKGEYIVFLNNDMRVKKNWLEKLVDKVTESDKIATASSKILSWDGRRINHGGADSDIFLNARLEGYMKRNRKGYLNKDKEILFPSGGSMIVNRKLFFKSGGFDEDFFAYYEDVDFGIRLKIMGYENHFVHDSIVYHMHSATSKKMPKEKLRVIQMRNLLWIMIKNYSDENLSRMFAPTFLLSLQRTFEMAGNFRSEKYDFLRIKSSKEKKIPFHIMKGFELMLLSDLMGYNDILLKWSKFAKKRNLIQSRRKNDDREVFKLMKSKFIPVVDNPMYVELYNSFLDLFKIKEINDKK